MQSSEDSDKQPAGARADFEALAMVTGAEGVSPGALAKAACLHSSGPVAFLIVTNGPMRNRVLVLQERTIVGRDPGSCQIALADDMVQRQHARFDLVSGQFEVGDLASRSGVYVNGKRVDRMMLLDGDVISLGNTTLLYRAT